MDVNMIMNFLHLIFIYTTKYNYISYLGKLGKFLKIKINPIHSPKTLIDIF